ncbi:MAG: hypothetical protein WC837_10465 [Bellilinea sp.]
MDTLPQKMDAFRKRWDVEYDGIKSLLIFKNRVQSIIEDELGALFLANHNLQNRFAYLIGHQPPYDGAKKVTGMELALEKIAGFRGTFIFNLFNNCTNLSELIWFIQHLIFLLEGMHPLGKQDNNHILAKFIKSIQEAIDLTPNLQIRLQTSESGTILVYNGAEELDDALVNEVIIWLDDYPEVEKPYKEALIMLSAKDKSRHRNLIDNLRLSIELLLKTLLHNDHRLEEQGKHLKVWMNNRGIEDNIRLMLTDLISRDRFTQMFNQSVKHGDRDWSEPELEFIVYQTGVLIRFLLQVNHLPSIS